MGFESIGILQKIKNSLTKRSLIKHSYRNIQASAGSSNVFQNIGVNVHSETRSLTVSVRGNESHDFDLILILERTDGSNGFTSSTIAIKSFGQASIVFSDIPINTQQWRALIANRDDNTNHFYDIDITEVNI